MRLAGVTIFISASTGLAQVKTGGNDVELKTATLSGPSLQLPLHVYLYSCNLQPKFLPLLLWRPLVPLTLQVPLSVFCRY